MFELRIFNDSIGIRLKNAVHLGKKFLAAIFTVIVYCVHRYFLSHGEWPSGLNSSRQVTEVKLGRVRSNSEWVALEA